MEEVDPTGKAQVILDPYGRPPDKGTRVAPHSEIEAWYKDVHADRQKCSLVPGECAGGYGGPLAAGFS